MKRYWLDVRTPGAVSLSHDQRGWWSPAPTFFIFRDLDYLRRVVATLRKNGFRREL